MRNLSDKDIIDTANKLEYLFSSQVITDPAIDTKLIIAYDVVIDNLLSQLKSEWEYNKNGSATPYRLKNQTSGHWVVKNS